MKKEKVLGILTVLISLSIVFLFNDSYNAEEIEKLKETKDKINSQITDTVTEINVLSNDIRDLYLDLDNLHTRMDLVMDKREDKELEFVDLNKELGNIKNEIHKSEIELSEKESEFKDRISSVYTRTNNIKEWLQLFFNSDGYGNLISNIRGYKVVINTDKDLLEEYTEYIKNLDHKKEKVNELVENIDNLLLDLNSYEDELEELTETNKLLTNKLEEDYKELEESLKNLAVESENIDKQIVYLEEKKIEMDRRLKEREEKEKKRLEDKEKKVTSEHEYNIDEDIDSIISEVSEEYGVPENLIKGVIRAESNFNINATNLNTNGTTDRGIMQLNSNTAPWLAGRIGIEYEVGVEFIPEYAIRMGTLYLKDHWDKGKGITYTLTAYNRGPSGADKWYRNNGTYETSYSEKVKKFMEEF